MDIGITPQELVKRLFDCLDANDMQDGVHIRLMVTRGVKATPYQDPRVTISPATIVIIPEYKAPKPEKFEKRHVAPHRQRAPRRSRCAGPEAQLAFQAQLHHRLHSGRQCRCRRSADARSARLCRHLQLHAFLHRAPRRGVDLDRAILHSRHHPRQHDPPVRENGIPVFEKQFSLYDVYGADEAFVTGTFAGLIPVRDHRRPPGAASLVARTNGRAPAPSRCACRSSTRSSADSDARTRPLVTTIAMWSGPRNISTAMMYAFGNRADCVAWDEPFYAFSLVHHGNDHPMRDEIIAGNDSDWDSLVARCLAPGRPKPVFYQKHMTHHMLTGYDRSWITGLTNAFLIRSPERVLASYAKKWSDVSLRDIGFVEQAEIFDMVADHLGRAPAVVDAEDILADPRGVLTKLCSACGIDFDEAMLSWPNPVPSPSTASGPRIGTMRCGPHRALRAARTKASDLASGTAAHRGRRNALLRENEALSPHLTCDAWCRHGLGMRRRRPRRLPSPSAIRPAQLLLPPRRAPPWRRSAGPCSSAMDFIRLSRRPRVALADIE